MPIAYGQVQVTKAYAGAAPVSRAYKSDRVVFGAQPELLVTAKPLFLRSAQGKTLTVNAPRIAPYQDGRITAVFAAYSTTTTIIFSVGSITGPSGATEIWQIGRVTNSRPLAFGDRLENAVSGDFTMGTDGPSGGYSAMGALVVYGCTKDDRVTGVLTSPGPHPFTAPAAGVLVAAGFSRTSSRELITPPSQGVVGYEDMFMSIGHVTLAPGEVYNLEMGSTGTVRIAYVFYPAVIQPEPEPEPEPTPLTQYASGDRTSLITVEIYGGLMQDEYSEPSQLVDGVNAPGLRFIPREFDAGAGSAILYRFNQPVVLKGFTWQQSAGAGHGMWQLEGSVTETGWTAIGGPIALGAATYSYASNTTAYSSYRLRHVSGSTSDPWLYDTLFDVVAP